VNCVSAARRVASMAPLVQPMAAFTCGACKEGYDESAWEMLVLVERIDPRDVRRFVSIWPEGVCVEARRCGRCGLPIAAKRPGRDGPR
jgi:hypothetical protein